jgi:hypothetical protein
VNPIRRYPNYLVVDGAVGTLGGRQLSLADEWRLRVHHRAQASRCEGEARRFHLRCWGELVLARRRLDRSRRRRP